MPFKFKISSLGKVLGQDENVFVIFFNVFVCVFWVINWTVFSCVTNLLLLFYRYFLLRVCAMFNIIVMKYFLWMTFTVFWLEQFYYINYLVRYFVLKSLFHVQYSYFRVLSVDEVPRSRLTNVRLNSAMSVLILHIASVD
jgi:hypothetical protein